MTGRMIRVAGYVTAALALLLCERLAHRAPGALGGVEASDRVLANPVAVLPLGDTADGHVGGLSADRWAAIERKFYPNRMIPDVSYLLHHILNWGVDARFTIDTSAVSGRTMLEILTDGRADPLYGPKAPLLYRAHDGRPRLARFGEPGSEGHPYQVLATFAALGLPSSQRIQSGTNSTTIAQLLEAVRSDFHLQGEIEWTTICLACYAPARRSWTNRWGRTFDFDIIANQFLTRPPGEGACAGTHTLYALTMLLRVQRNSPHRLGRDPGPDSPTSRGGGWVAGSPPADLWMLDAGLAAPLGRANLRGI